MSLIICYFAIVAKVGLCMVWKQTLNDVKKRMLLCRNVYGLVTSWTVRLKKRRKKKECFSAEIRMVW